jgi:hypothetical protein
MTEPTLWEAFQLFVLGVVAIAIQITITNGFKAILDLFRRGKK